MCVEFADKSQRTTLSFAFRGRMETSTSIFARKILATWEMHPGRCPIDELQTRGQLTANISSRLRPPNCPYSKEREESEDDEHNVKSLDGMLVKDGVVSQLSSHYTGSSGTFAVLERWLAHCCDNYSNCLKRHISGQNHIIPPDCWIWNHSTTLTGFQACPHERTGLRRRIYDSNPLLGKASFHALDIREPPNLSQAHQIFRAYVNVSGGRHYNPPASCQVSMDRLAVHTPSWESIRNGLAHGIISDGCYLLKLVPQYWCD